MNTSQRPLDGIRVLEAGQLLAGPFAGCMLAYYGAEVIKVEPPGSGDPLRQWRELDEDGTSWWWRSLGRNKKCITADLRSDVGRQLVGELAGKCDVLIENFRPGVMEKWGLGPADLWANNPGLIYARISGYGQDGPYSARPGFASVCEGVGGLRYVNGKPGEAPMRPNLSLGDTIAGLHTALGIVMACTGKEHRVQGDRLSTPHFTRHHSTYLKASSLNSTVPAWCVSLPGLRLPVLSPPIPINVRMANSSSSVQTEIPFSSACATPWAAPIWATTRAWRTTPAG